MVGDLQDEVPERLACGLERRFPFLLQVSGEEEGDQPPVQAEDEGIIVFV